MVKRLTQEDYENRMLKLQLYIQRNLNSELELEKLAKIAAFSPYHFHRIFRAIVGESLQSYIRRLRLEASAYILVQSDTAITDVARNARYDNLESFIRSFRERFGVSPGQYRKQKQLPRFRKLVLQIKSKGSSKMTVQVKEEIFPAMKVAFVRHIGPYHECCKAWKTLCNDPAVQKYLGPQSTCLGISYDDPSVTDSDKLRYDACIKIDDNFQAGRGISVQELKGGRAAVFRHVGAYSKLFETYQYIYGEWLPCSGYRLQNSPPLEIYRNFPDTTPEQDLITDIYLLLK